MLGTRKYTTTPLRLFSEERVTLTRERPATFASTCCVCRSRRRQWFVRAGGRAPRRADETKKKKREIARHADASYTQSLRARREENTYGTERDMHTARRSSRNCRQRPLRRSSCLVRRRPSRRRRQSCRSCACALEGRNGKYLCVVPAAYLPWVATFRRVCWLLFLFLGRSAVEKSTRSNTRPPNILFRSM